MTVERRQRHGSDFWTVRRLRLDLRWCDVAGDDGLVQRGVRGSNALEGGWGNADLVLILGVPSALIGGVIYAIGRWLRPKT